MAFTKIEPSDLIGKGVVGLPDSPGLTATQMQEKFDELALDVIVPKFNELSDALDPLDGADADIQDLKDATEALTWASVPTFSNIPKGVHFLKINSGVSVGGVTLPSACYGSISVGNDGAVALVSDSTITNKYVIFITSANSVTCKKVDTYHMALSGTSLAITTV